MFRDCNRWTEQENAPVHWSIWTGALLERRKIEKWVSVRTVWVSVLKTLIWLLRNSGYQLIQILFFYMGNCFSVLKICLLKSHFVLSSSGTTLSRKWNQNSTELLRGLPNCSECKTRNRIVQPADTEIGSMSNFSMLLIPHKFRISG